MPDQDQKSDPRATTEGERDEGVAAVAPAGNGRPQMRAIEVTAPAAPGGAAAAGNGGGASGGDGGPTGAGDGGDGGAGHIVELQIERELQDSYLTYAMSTIMDRALPDVRDGLKPSQRRILVAMNDLNLRPGRKHLKCAKIAGDTSGNYHPHGESVIYPTLVGMAQRWRMRVPLIDPQGNFGSLDGDPPAAMRYTEARMTHAAVDMLEDLKLDTVDVVPNYDDRLMEPTVLPGRFPNLLVNGGVGIAVGMATSLAPHNPIEIFDAIIRTLEDPDIGFASLMTDVVERDDAGRETIIRRGVKGPDFPTGGVVMGRMGIVDAYATGRGKVTVRGQLHTEQIGRGATSRTALVIDSIPYNLVQTTLMERIVDAVKDERIGDVSDVRNESGREAQTRIVIELKKGADPEVVENQLYQFTPLQQNFSIHNIALVNRQPRTLSLKELIQLYIDHRVEVVRRRTAHLLREAKKRAHVLEALVFVVAGGVERVVALIRSSDSRAEAIERLMAWKFILPDAERGRIPGRFFDRVAALSDPSARWAQFDRDHPADHAHLRRHWDVVVSDLRSIRGVGLTRVQAQAICDMRLSQLTGLEIDQILTEYRKVTAQIEEYETILAERRLVLDMIKADCEDMRARYLPRFGPRLTTIDEREDGGDIIIEALIPVQDVAVTISHQGYAKRVPLETYRQQGRGGKGITAAGAKDDDFIEHVLVASTHDNLLVFTDRGRVFKIKVYEIKEMSRQSKGIPLINVLEGLREGEKARAFLNLPNLEEGERYLTFVSRAGVVKRTALRDYRNVHRGGIIAVGLREGDSLLEVIPTSGTDDLMLVTSEGMAIRFNEDDVRLMGRPAAGVKGIELEEGNGVVGVMRIPMKPDPDGALMTDASEIERGLCLLTVTANGYGKRTAVDEYRVTPEAGKMRSQSRGGKGRVDIRTTQRNGPAVAALGVYEGDDIIVLTRNGMLVRMAASSISCYGRGTQGVRVVGFRSDDEVVSVSRVAENGEGGALAAADGDQ